MTKKVLIVITLLLLVVSAINSQESKEEERKKKEEALMKDIMEEHGPIHLIGKVVDQNGDGVQGAEVIYFYNWFCLGHEYFYCDKWETVKTDEKGIFEIKVDKKVRTLNINKILKDGYDSGFDGKGFKGERIFSKYSPLVNPKAEASENIRIFQIRKKGEPVMLLTSEGNSKMTFATKRETTIFAINLLNPVGYNLKVYEASLEDTYRIDLFAEGRYDEKGYKLKFKANGEKGSGIIVKEEKLYTAPEEGYEKEYVLESSKRYDFSHPLYLYCRTGEPLIYSEIKLEIYPSEEKVTVSFYSTTNPYGERNLEHGRYLYSLKKADDLKHEAWGSLAEKRYPKKPDFRALEEEGKKEYLKKQKENQ